MNEKKYPVKPGATGHGIGGGKAGVSLSTNPTLRATLCQSASAQRQRILEHLNHDTLTTLQARAMGIMHPGMRVCELRKQGYQITTDWVTEYCAGGVRHRVASYRLGQNQECL